MPNSSESGLHVPMPIGAQTGMTLVEVTLAIVVLTAGLVSIMMVMTSAMQQKESSREYEYATNAALTKMEEIRGYAGVDFTDLATRYSGADYKEFCINCNMKHITETVVSVIGRCNSYNSRSGLLPWGRNWDGSSATEDWNTGFITITSTMPTLIEVAVQIKWLSRMGENNEQIVTMRSLVTRASKD